MLPTHAAKQEWITIKGECGQAVMVKGLFGGEMNLDAINEMMREDTTFKWRVLECLLSIAMPPPSTHGKFKSCEKGVDVQVEYDIPERFK